MKGISRIGKLTIFGLIVTISAIDPFPGRTETSVTREPAGSLEESQRIQYKPPKEGFGGTPRTVGGATR